jgi:hypothetical protein
MTNESGGEYVAEEISRRAFDRLTPGSLRRREDAKRSERVGGDL